jgi:prepilin-type N-terminal cleavage/methylation domain-containing protein
MIARGFTLIEMMIVVAIIGVLAVIAGTAYRRYMDSGRKAEVYAVLGEIRAKQEAFRVENPTYRSSAGETDLFPALIATAKVEPKAHPITPPSVTPPTWWSDLGIAPQKSSLYCSYTTVAGLANVAPGGTRGAAIFATASNPSAIPNVQWWYAIGTCDNDSDGNAAHNAYFTTSSQTTSVYTENEHW